jgi:hypothetical protein
VDDSESGELFRFSVDQLAPCCDAEDCTHLHLVKVYLKQDGNLPYEIHTYEEWFVGELDAVARSNSMEPKELRDLLCSEDPIQRAQAYLDIAGYHGAANLDHEPRTITLKEWEKRNKPKPARCECEGRRVRTQGDRTRCGRCGRIFSSQRRTVQDHVEAALTAVNAMLAGEQGAGDWPADLSAASLEAARKWLLKRLRK